LKIPRKQFTASVPTFAMGDIGFLLLIFFVILARTQDDSHVQWDPAKLKDVESSGAPMASVAIDTQNKIFLNGEEIGVDQITTRLEAILGDTPEGSRNVYLKVHKYASARVFEPVMEAVGAAGGDLFHILENEPEKENP
jgi:biopolymer transport protein ExbD